MTDELPRMPQVLRWLEIDRLLRQPHRSFDTRALARATGVDVRTTRRDLRLLRSRFQAPIYYSREHSGYRYQADYAGPALLARDLRTLALTIASYLDRSWRGGPPDPQWWARALEAAQGIQGSFHWNPSACRPCVELAADRPQLLTYYDAARDRVGQVVLRQVVIEDGDLVEGQARLPFSRVHFVDEAGDQELEPPSVPSEHPPVVGRVWFAKAWRWWVLQQEIFPVTECFDSAGGVRVELQASSSAALLNWLAGFGTGARLLGPPALVSLFRSTLLRVLIRLEEADAVCHRTV